MILNEEKNRQEHDRIMREAYYPKKAKNSFWKRMKKILLGSILFFFVGVPLICLAAYTLQDYFTTLTTGNDSQIWGGNCSTTGSYSSTSFTASSTYPLTQLSRSLDYHGTNSVIASNVYTIALYAASSLKPTGSILTSTTFLGSAITNANNAQEYDFPVSSHTVTSGNSYAVVLSTSAAQDGTNWIGTGITNSASTGTNKAFYSTDCGTTWIADGNSSAQDFFKTWSGSAPVTATQAPQDFMIFQ